MAASVSNVLNHSGIKISKSALEEVDPLLWLDTQVEQVCSLARY